MRRSASEIIRNLESRIARLEKSAFKSWEETATDELVEELGLDPSEVSSDYDFTVSNTAVLRVKTRWDDYILFESEKDFKDFIESEMKEMIESLSYTKLSKMLAKSRQPLTNFTDKDVYLEVEDTDLLKRIPKYRNIVKKVEDETVREDLIFDLCESINKNPLLGTKSEKLIKEIYEYLSVDISEMVEEFGIPLKNYEVIGGYGSGHMFRESYVLRVL